MIRFPAGLAAGLSAVTVALLVARLVPPTRRLAGRVRPYSAGGRIRLGRPADVAVVAGGPVVALFGPIVGAAAARLGRILDRSGDDALALRLRQAGLFPDLAEEERVAAYRLRQLRSVVGWTAAAVAGAVVLRLSTVQALGTGVLGLVVGATRERGRLERAIDDRRTRMRIEIYTVDQLLALRVRAGGGVVQATQHLVARGSGAVVAELAEALRLHRAGMRASAAFTRIAELTPEPACARTYGLLAIADERGVDLAHALLALADDVREARREAIRRTATKRRAAMLVPTIVILAPVMLLFVGAPLPSLILGLE